MPNVRQGDFLNASDKLIVAAKANPGEPKVDELRQELEQDMAGAREAQSRRDFYKAAGQQASRDLDGYLASARVIYSRLRHLLIGVFGLRAEKLAEFGLKVLRPPQVTPDKVELNQNSRSKNKKKPSESGMEPTRTADSQIDSAS
jgi:hypothetical protein